MAATASASPPLSSSTLDDAGLEYRSTDAAVSSVSMPVCVPSAQPWLSSLSALSSVPGCVAAPPPAVAPPWAESASTAALGTTVWSSKCSKARLWNNDTSVGSGRTPHPAVAALDPAWRRRPDCDALDTRGLRVVVGMVCARVSSGVPAAKCFNTSAANQSATRPFSAGSGARNATAGLGSRHQARGPSDPRQGRAACQHECRTLPPNLVRLGRERARWWELCFGGGSSDHHPACPFFGL